MFTARQVAETIGVPHRTLMFWAEHGLLRPTVPLRGKWEPTGWSEKDLREAQTLAELRRAGVSLQTLRQALRFLRELGHNPMSTGRFLAFRTERGRPVELVKVCEGGEILHLTGQYRGQLALFPVPEDLALPVPTDEKEAPARPARG